MIVAYSVINFIIQSIIQPKVMADAVSLSLTLTFLSLVFWSFVIGPIGAMLAIPMTLLTKALLLDADRTPDGYPACSKAAPYRPSDEDADDAADDDATPDRASEAPADRIASAAGGQGPRSPSSATVSKLD